MPGHGDARFATSSRAASLGANGRTRTPRRGEPFAHGGALVLSVLGIHTQDSASGDFSLSAPQVLRIDNGLDGRTRATISGNLFEVLRSDALQLVDFEGEHTPGMLFPCRIDGVSG